MRELEELNPKYLVRRYKRICLLCGRDCGGVEAGDVAVGAGDERERQGVPVAFVEGLPGFAVVAADVGTVGAGGDPEFERLEPLDSGAVAVGRGDGRGPVMAAIGGPGGGAGGVVGLAVVAAYDDAMVIEVTREVDVRIHISL